MSQTWEFPALADPNLPVSYGMGGFQNGSDLLRDIELLAQKLPIKKGRSIGIFLDDSYEFAVAFLTVISLGHHPVLPMINQPDRLKLLEGEVDHWLTNANKTPSNPISTQTPKVNPKLNTEGLKLKIQTSGSTGEPVLHTKALSSLFLEAQSIEERWCYGHSKKQAVFSSVPHHHIYGLLFRVLWPLLSGRAFNGDSGFTLEMAQDHFKKGLKSYFVSCPSHLSRLQKANPRSLGPDSLSMIFSSGGMLEESTAKWWHEKGFAPVEVLGSTETGGLAQRTFGHAYPSWEFFEQVQLQSACLGLHEGPKIVSPFTGQSENVTMGDRIELDTDLRHFVLMGRTDRIVKVQEKRVSLKELEDYFLERPNVGEVKFFLPQDGRGRLLGVVKMDRSSLKDYIQKGHTQMVKTWVSHLRQRFDPEVIPRQWRVITEWPVNPLGKTTQEDLVNYFKDDFSTTEDQPYLFGLSREGSEVILNLEVPAHLKYFKGHFPDVPLVAGVVQLHWIQQSCRDHLQLEPIIERLLRLKFKSIILPGQKLTLHLKTNDDRDRVEASFMREGAEVSSCTLVLKKTP